MKKQQLNTEIIAVGTELLLGQIANTNAQWISDQLAHNGINTFYHTVVGDNKQRVATIFEHAQKRSNVVIVTGGLGPTVDDLSREAFHEMTEIPIVEEKNAMEKIIRFYQNQNIPMTPNNKRQARVFKDSIILTNKFGMAPGNIVEYNDVIWIFLPGVPREMKQIFSDEVIPYLKKINGEMIIESTVLRFTGIGESALEHKLQSLIASQRNPTIAPLAQKDGLTVRLTAKAQSKEKAKIMIEETKAAILNEVGEFYYGENNERLEEKVFNLLKQKGKRIASAESLTGGLFADKLVSLNGATAVFAGGVVCYDPAVKENVLNVLPETIQSKGTVSEQCASELAENVSHLLQTSIGISFTGVAGPDEIEGKRVGTVFIGLYDTNGYKHIEECHFSGNRDQIRHRAVFKGYELLFNYLK